MHAAGGSWTSPPCSGPAKEGCTRHPQRMGGRAEERWGTESASGSSRPRLPSPLARCGSSRGLTRKPNRRGHSSLAHARPGGGVHAKWGMLGSGRPLLGSRPAVTRARGAPGWSWRRPRCCSEPCLWQPQTCWVVCTRRVAARVKVRSTSLAPTSTNHSRLPACGSLLTEALFLVLTPEPRAGPHGTRWDTARWHRLPVGKFSRERSPETQQPPT